MKILHLTTVHPINDGRIFHKEANALGEFGFDISLMGIKTKTSTISKNVKLIEIERKNRFGRIVQLRELSKKISGMEIDVLHIHDPELLPVAVKVKKNKGNLKIIYDAHELYHADMEIKDWIPFFFRKPMNLIVDKLEMYYAKKFDVVITPTEELTKRFSSLKETKTYTINNFPIASNFQVVKAAKKEYDVIHVGSISPFRMEFFLEIIKTLNKREKSIKWCFLGVAQSTIDWTNENYSKEIVENIHFLEKVPFEEVPNIIGKSRIAINYHPLLESFKVAIPVKIFEYILSNVPVISSALPPLNRLFKNREILLLENNADNFASAIEDLLNNYDLQNQMVTNAKIKVLEEYSWEQEKHKLIKLYKELSNA